MTTIHETLPETPTAKDTSPFIRGLELLFCLLSLPFLSLFFLIVMTLSKLESGEKILESVACCGKNGKQFDLYRFALPGFSGRSSTIGRFLARYNLGRLPFVINIIRGELSLVGPRPRTLQQLASYTPEQQQVLCARPGVISPAQLYYWEKQKLLATDKWSQLDIKRITNHKLMLEIAFLQHRTMWADLAILLRTFIASITGGKRLNVFLELRNRHFLLLDICLLLVLPMVALTLREEGIGWWPGSSQALVLYTAVSLTTKLLVFYATGLYWRYWPYASVNDMTTVVTAVTVSTVLLTLFALITHHTFVLYDLALFRTIPIIDGLLTALAIGGTRFGLRATYHWHRRYQNMVVGRRALIVGAGEAGIMTVREMLANPHLHLEPVGFVDDDFSKVNSHIHGLPVLGTSEDVPQLVNRFQIQRVIIAIPSAPLGRQQKVTAMCQKTGAAVDTLPGIYQILAGHKTVSPLPLININHILRRDPIPIDDTGLEALVKDRVILVTGAGGSIGSQLCMQIARFQPAQLILLGHGENSIFEINLRLRLAYPDLVTHQAIVDVRDQRRVDSVIGSFKPYLIFHAAAHKHVHFMQESVEEAVTNNVLGTKNVLDAAQKYDVERFVLISSDKAINPVNVMGATKRIAELLTKAAAQESGRAYMAVRFGNVLGSRGSVIPVFQQQIAQGGPVTITHPDMYRYFMTIPEAVHLVLQAALLGTGGKIFVLDMGSQIRILDLAVDLIRLSGLQVGRDIQIIYSGIRPGEKLREELFLENESYLRTAHQKIFVATSQTAVNETQLHRDVDELIALAQQLKTRATLNQMRIIVPEYRPFRAKSPQPKSSMPPRTTETVTANYLTASYPRK